MIKKQIDYHPEIYHNRNFDGIVIMKEDDFYFQSHSQII